MREIEEIYNEIWRRTLDLHICTVPFMWRSIDNLWVVSVEIWSKYEKHTDELREYGIDERYYGVSDDTLIGALIRYKSEFLPLLEKLAKKVRRD